MDLRIIEIPSFVPLEYRQDLIPSTWKVKLLGYSDSMMIPSKIDAAIASDFFAYQLALHWFIKLHFHRGYKVPFERRKDVKAFKPWGELFRSTFELCEALHAYHLKGGIQYERPTQWWGLVSIDLWNLFYDPVLMLEQSPGNKFPSKRSHVKKLRNLAQQFRDFQQSLPISFLHLINLVDDYNELLINDRSLQKTFVPKYLTKNSRRLNKKGFWESFENCISAFDRDKEFGILRADDANILHRSGQNEVPKKIDPK